METLTVESALGDALIYWAHIKGDTVSAEVDRCHGVQVTVM